MKKRIMKKRILILILIAAHVLLLGGCTIVAPITRTIKGEGEIVSRTYETDDFTGIDIGGSSYVTFRYSDSSSVVIETYENLFEHLEVKTAGGVLDIGFGNNVSVDTGRNKVQIHISSPLLTSIDFGGSVEAKDWDTIRAEHFSIDVSGSGNVNISLEVESLDIDASGSAAIELSGSANTVVIDKSGSSNINAISLQTKDADIESSGSGSIEIAVSDSMKVDLSGSGRIRYIGSPSIRQDVSGSARIEKISD